MGLDISVTRLTITNMLKKSDQTNWPADKENGITGQWHALAQPERQNIKGVRFSRLPLGAFDKVACFFSTEEKVLIAITGVISWPSSEFSAPVNCVRELPGRFPHLPIRFVFFLTSLVCRGPWETIFLRQKFHNSFTEVSASFLWQDARDLLICSFLEPLILNSNFANLNSKRLFIPDLCLIDPNFSHVFLVSLTYLIFVV